MHYHLPENNKNILKLAVERMKQEKELAKAKTRVKATEEQEELEKGKALDFGLNSGNQI